MDVECDIVGLFKEEGTAVSPRSIPHFPVSSSPFVETLLSVQATAGARGEQGTKDGWAVKRAMTGTRHSHYFLRRGNTVRKKSIKVCVYSYIYI